MNSKTKRITLYAIMFAVILVAMTLDRTFSTFNILSFAIFTVASTAVFALSKDNVWDALAAGFFFGLASNLTAFWFGRTTFYYPWNAILPRMFVGITAYGAYKLVQFALKRFTKTGVCEYIALSVGGALTALSNTVYTLTCLFLFAKGDPLFAAFAASFVTNILPELIIATVATPMLVLGVRRGLGLGVDGKPRSKKKNETINAITTENKI